MDYKKYYEFYKLELETHNEEFISSCPFCEKEDHLFISSVTGMYHCKKCDAEGNHLTFITELHKKYLERTTKQEYTLLHKLRGISSESLITAGFAYDPIYERWLVPYRNGSEFLKSLGVFYPSSSMKKNRFTIYKPPGLDLPLFRPFDPKTFTKEVWICEGEWDALAMHTICRSKKKKLPSILGLPGATSWKESFNKSLKDSTVVFFFDNDDAGEKGKEKIRKVASGFTYGFAKWTLTGDGEENVPDKYDIRQLLLDAESRTHALSIVTEMASDADVTVDEVVKPQSKGFTVDMEDIEEIPSFATFSKRIKENFYTNDSMFKSIVIVLGAALAVRLPGEPVWLFLVGEPSSGKSRVIEAFGGSNQYFEYASKVTAESLVSGMKVDGQDTSFLPSLDKKTFFIKDLTVILGQPDIVQQKLWDLLRDAYDGYLKIVYGNGVVREYTGFNFNLVAGVTQAIHRHNDSELGARFLKCDFTGPDFDTNAHMDMAIANRSHHAENKKKFMHTMLGYFKYLMNNIDPENPPLIPKEISDKIKSLGHIVAKLRTKIVKDRYEGMLYRPTSEVPTRLVLQFMNAAQGIAWARQEDEVTFATYQHIKKIAFDSCHELSLEVVEYIFKKGKATRKQIVDDLKLPKTRVHQIISDFVQLGLLEYDLVPNSMASQGRNAERYIVTEEIAECLRDVKPKPKSKPTKKSSKKSKTSV